MGGGLLGVGHLVRALALSSPSRALGEGFAGPSSDPRPNQPEGWEGWLTQQGLGCRCGWLPQEGSALLGAQETPASASASGAGSVTPLSPPSKQESQPWGPRAPANRAPKAPASGDARFCPLSGWGPLFPVKGTWPARPCPGPAKGQGETVLASYPSSSSRPVP